MVDNQLPSDDNIENPEAGAISSPKHRKQLQIGRSDNKQPLL